uniref:Uncharacterized protein n=1 Tax=Arundo donax TaxID=35708 RepID=A0A0A9GVF4_ARUDO
MIKALSEGLEPFPRYEAEPMHVEINLEVIWTLEEFVLWSG